MKSSIFFTIVTALLFGMVLGMFVIPDQTSKLLLTTIVGSLVWVIVCNKLYRRRNPRIILFLFLTSTIIGFWRTEEFHKRYPFTAFDRYNNQTITIAGVVDSSPTFKPGNQYVQVRPEVIDGLKIKQPSRDIILKFSDMDSFAAGDRIVVSGKFAVRSNFESDTGRTVEYSLMSYSRKIAGDIKFPTLKQSVSGHNPLKFFDNIKRYFLKTLNTLFVAPASGLLSGIIIGDTSSLDSGLLDIFRAVGLIHIVVLSGYNITLVANFFVGMFASLGYHRRLVAAMLALIFFILIVGISPTATRAGIMALCAFAARYYIRPYIISRGIALALVIMVWMSPYSLLFDLSLQLSFLATLGIVYVFPMISERYESLVESTLGEILLQTIAVNVLTLPIIIYQMGYFSLISFPVNIAILSFIPWLTVGGFASVFAGMVLQPLGRLIAFPFQIMTDSIITIAAWAASHDPFKITFPIFSIYWILAIYMVIFWYVFVKTRKHSTLQS